MLRRILVPFSELFILLALMFLSLFFISAALGGKGESRPEDEINLVEIVWDLEPDWEFSKDQMIFSDSWYGMPGVFISASDANSAIEGRWSFFWAGTSPGSTIYDWSSIYDGQCSSINDLESSSRIRTLERRREILGSIVGNQVELREETAIPALIDSNGDTLFSVSRDWSATLLSEANDGLAKYRFRLRFLFAFRPIDLDRDLELEIGWLLPAPSISVDVPVGSDWRGAAADPGEAIISVRKGTTNEPLEVIGEIQVSDFQNISWKDNGRTNRSDAPIYFSNPSCEQFGATVRIFTRIGRDEIYASPFPPRMVTR